MLISLPGWMPLSTRTWNKEKNEINFILYRYFSNNKFNFHGANRWIISISNNILASGKSKNNLKNYRDQITLIC